MCAVVYNMLNPDDFELAAFVSNIVFNATCSSAIDFNKLELEKVQNTMLVTLKVLNIQQQLYNTELGIIGYISGLR